MGSIDRIWPHEHKTILYSSCHLEFEVELNLFFSADVGIVGALLDNTLIDDNICNGFFVSSFGTLITIAMAHAVTHLCIMVASSPRFGQIHSNFHMP